MINLNMSNNNSLQGNVFVKPEDHRELARFGLARIFVQARAEHKACLIVMPSADENHHR